MSRRASEFSRLFRLLVLTLVFGVGASAAPAGHWNVDELRPGMSGYGLTVLKGTRAERFTVEILGVVKNVTPARDIVLCRVGGLGLEKTGVLSGMSGSPVYVDDKLVGAIAFTWAFGKEPIGGITPYSQMLEYSRPTRPSGPGIAEISYLLDRPLPALGVGSRSESALVAWRGETASLVPIGVPVAVTGLSPYATEELGRLMAPVGMAPVLAAGPAKSGGARGGQHVRFEPGGAMAVALATGDVSLSAIGTVTAISGKRVYGFGHPFLSLGKCELPLWTAQIHAVIPRQSVGFKFGSPLEFAGRLDCDASTCVAGMLGESVEMLPVSVQVRSDVTGRNRAFECKVARERSMLGMLAFTILGSCADLDGGPPLDSTTKIKARIEVEGYPPLVLEDTFSGAGFAGQQGLFRAFLPIGNLLIALSNNPFERPKIKSLSCRTEMLDGRRSARLHRAEAEHEALEPGETLRVRAYLEPYRGGEPFLAEPRPAAAAEAGPLRVVELGLKLPESMAPGKYTATIGDAGMDLRAELTNRPHLLAPKDFRELYEFLSLQLSGKRTELTLRVDGSGDGVAIDGVELPSLPGGVADLLASDRGAVVSPLRTSLVARVPTDWCVEGATQVRFEVVKEKKFFVP